MPDRSLTVRLVADSSSLQKELKKSQQALAKYKQAAERGGAAGAISSEAAAVRDLAAAEGSLAKIRGPRGGRLGPFRIAGVGTAAAIGVSAAIQSTRALSDALETTGKAALTTQGRLKNMGAALLGGDFVGAIGALTRQAKTLEEAGLTNIYDPARLEALRQVASGATGTVNELGKSGRFATDEFRKLQAVTELAGTSNAKMAQAALDNSEAMQKAGDAARHWEFAQRHLNVAIVDGKAALVEFKGAADDIAGPRGPGARAFETPYRRPGMPTLPGLSPSDRRELELIGAEAMKRIPLLQDRLRQLKGQLQGFHGSYQQRLTILQNIEEAEKEIGDIQADAAAAQAAAAKRRADEAKRLAEQQKRLADQIKSAVIERLQRRQTNILDRRALQDALEQLRIAKQMGGPRGILEARRGVTDVRYEMMIARLQAQPATLTKGGMFSLGNQITINVNGATDPDKIARQVVSIIQRRTKQTNEQTRGSTAGSATGNK